MTTHAVRICITDSEGKALVQLRKDYGEYVFIFFGGRVEAGEEPLNAAVREVREELGLVIKPEELQHLDTWLNPEGIYVLHYKLLRPITWADVANNEDYGIAMVPYQEIRQVPLSLSMKWFTEKFPELPA